MSVPSTKDRAGDPGIASISQDVADEAGGVGPDRSAACGTRLTAEQRRLVADNIGLVGVHIRRNVPHIEQPTREREQPDLFQEGCLGLVKAALAYHKSRGRIPFPAFALMRIRTYVDRALQRSFETVRLPDAEIDARAQAGCRRARVFSLDFEPATRPERQRHRPGAPEDGDTIAGRVRQKYEAAVDRAAADLRRSPRADAGTGAVVDCLVKGRLLIPEEENRVPLREIARLTGCPFARVVYTENRLLQCVRAALSGDAELAGLRAEARRASAGMDTPIDRNVSRRVAAVVGERFRHLFGVQPQQRKAVILLDLMKQQEVPVQRLAEALFDRLTHKDKLDQMRQWFELRTPEQRDP